MVIKCILCTNKYGPLSINITFHRFPKDYERFNKWVNFCRRPDLLEKGPSICNKTYKLCSEHFVETDFKNNGWLINSAVPSIFNWPDAELQQNSSLKMIPEESIPSTSSTSRIMADSVDIYSNSISSINWSNISAISCSTPKTSSVSRSLSYSSGNSSTATSNSQTQIHQCLSSNTPRKDKLNKLLSIQKNKFNDLHKQFLTLKKHCSDLEKKSSTLEFFHLMCDNFLNKGFANFVKIQSKLTLQDPHGHRYSYEIKQFALMVHFMGPKVYRFLRKSWSLPSVRTLQRTTENWEINPGLNDFLFKVLAVKANSMTVKSKECILCVDEMSLKSFLYFDFKKDEIIGFLNTGFIKSCDVTKSVMVIMISGLHSSWKQPIGYFFVATTCTGYDLQNIIFQTVQKLSNISFNVVVMISDLGSNFKHFADQQGITPQTPYFNVGDKEIVYMFDPPHLLKATRNNFFNYRFNSQNKIAEKIHLTNFYDLDKSNQHRLAPKLTDVHLNPNSFQKMRVKFAAQVFSHTVVTGMTTLVSCNELPHSAFDTIDFIDSMDKLFDIFNSRPISTEVSNHEGSKRYSLPFSNSSYQTDFLNLMFNYFENLEIQKFDAEKNEWVNIARQYNIKFINGWLISIAGLNRLYQNLTNNSDSEIDPICTYRTNQDKLENFFGTARIQNGNCINPTCIQFKRTFKKLFCLDYFEHSEGANCIQDLDDVLLSLEKTPISEFKILFPEKNPIQIPLPITNITNYKQINLPEQNALTYICGYLIGQCLKVHQCTTCLNFAQATTSLSSETFYCHFKSYEENPSLLFGNLIMPNSTFYQYIFQINQVFDRHFISLAPQPNVGKTLKDLILNTIFFYHPCDNFPKDFLINLFLRFQIHNSLNRTNKEYQALRTGKKNRKVQILSNL
ncbi:unnamed protein product [Macrosiphum euphorbiae]|uniref:THAP-type domain-containing protein n=1 Tax=Macrosiphum euphorbiae TaxID=13131 RepID=A0AAV0XK98_9HEMI|nr:unnamed protein product [Macrosiphum euphorbiae]